MGLTSDLVQNNLVCRVFLQAPSVRLRILRPALATSGRETLPRMRVNLQSEAVSALNEEVASKQCLPHRLVMIANRVRDRLTLHLEDREARLDGTKEAKEGAL